MTAGSAARRRRGGGRRLRADARRNRARVLEAAREVFAAEGLAVPLDEIARRAGVGAGTVYRHFPTKEALFEAVVTDRIKALTKAGHEALARIDAGADPGEAFFGQLAVVVADAGSKMDLADALVGAGVDLQQATLDAAGDLRATLGELLTRAQSADAVRTDIDVADLHALVAGAVAAERARATDTRPGRLTQIISDGLRPARSTTG
ncbi:TetR/AcrR family transcriptional regulator [Kitasatospora sp. NBC_01302]|uniref:TetR/AcrR family transcriptional regulator n=1 Tax=Kitasatospora sp. NBC_01302 TaxID=2903575 RepID=UPI002E0FF13D|nr:TetR/AcrR family transcriptional regulator [Kitasatospora sp. NBC_01302]